MSVDLLTPGPHHRRSEFVYDPAQGIWLYGCCGQQALAMAAWNATGQPHDVLSVYRLMRSHGLCDVNGASTPAELRQAALLLGLTITEFVGYGGDNWPGWQTFLARHAGRDVVVLELSHGQALVDAISGQGENATNLRYHYIGGFGASGDGWLFADGDNYAGGNTSANQFNATDVLQRYSFATLGNAQPCAAIAIHVPGGGQAMAWTFESDGTARDAQGHTCGAGFAATLKANAALAASDGLLSETYYAPSASFLPLANGDMLSWDGHSVRLDQAAQVAVALWQQLQAAKNAPPSPAPAQAAKAAALDNLMALYGVK